MKISLILPVYNVEQYLARCLNSCICQNIPNNEYEIIIVNDGSTDKSLEIATNYSNRYSFIKIVTQNNQGLSAARNTGLKLAKGKYVWFIDSDDYISSNCLSGIIQEMFTYNLDALWLKWHNENEKHQIIPLYADTLLKDDVSVYRGLDFMENVMGIYYFAWSFIFKKEFLIRNNLAFCNGLYYEDSEFAYRAIPKMQAIKLHDKDCYVYNVRNGSIAQTVSKKKIDDLIFIAGKAIEANNLFRNYNCFARSASNIIFTALMQSIKIKYKEGTKRIRLILKKQKQMTVSGNTINHILVGAYNLGGFNITYCIAVIAVLLKKLKEYIVKIRLISKK